MNRGQFTVAIAGATGRLGLPVSEVFLTDPFKCYFPRVVVFARNTQSEKAARLSSRGAEVVHVDFTGQQDDMKRLISALDGIDILINVLGETKGHEKQILVDAAVSAGVKTYFPSEFGVDHSLNDFPGFDHEAWIKKREHVNYANTIAGGRMKVISVFVGLFLSTAINLIYEFDTSLGTISVVGPSNNNVSYTSTSDIGRSLAQLSIMSFNPDFPEYIRISGGIINSSNIQTISKEAGLALDIVSKDLSKEKDSLQENYHVQKGMAKRHIQILAGEGKLDFSTENDNEMVNPGQKLWKWESIDNAIKQNAAALLAAQRDTKPLDS